MGKQIRETRSKDAFKIPMRQYVPLRLESKIQFDYDAHENVNLL